MDSLHIENILKRDVSSLGCSLWGVEFFGRLSSQTLRVFIDKEDGVSVEDCEKVSKHISRVIEADENLKNSYMLEVSSPGLDRKFFKNEQYGDYIGCLLKVKFLNEENKYISLIGNLESTHETKITLKTDSKILEIDFNSIKKANLYITEV